MNDKVNDCSCILLLLHHCNVELGWPVHHIYNNLVDFFAEM